MTQHNCFRFVFFLHSGFPFWFFFFWLQFVNPLLVLWFSSFCLFFKKNSHNNDNALSAVSICMHKGNVKVILKQWHCGLFFKFVLCLKKKVCAHLSLFLIELGLCCFLILSGAIIFLQKPCQSFYVHDINCIVLLLALLCAFMCQLLSLPLCERNLCCCVWFMLLVMLKAF